MKEYFAIGENKDGCMFKQGWGNGMATKGVMWIYSSLDRKYSSIF